ncbi:MAG: PAS domain S-box protein, partial [Myxococcales bacterium]
MSDPVDELQQRLRSLPDPVALLEGIFAYAPVGFQIYRADGHSLLTNRAFRELFGTEPPPEYNILRDEVAREAGFLDLIHRAFEGETITIAPTWYDPRELEHVTVREGRRVAISSTIFPLRDRDGRVSHVAIVFKDVTAETIAKEEAQARQRQAEEDRNLLDAIIRHSGDAVVVADAQGVIRVFNEEAERQTGVRKQDVPAQDWSRAYGLFGLDKKPLALQDTPLFRALKGERCENVRWLVRRPDGEFRAMVGTASPLPRADGSFGGAMLVARDETQRVRLEEELRSSEERLRSIFASDMLGIGFWAADGAITDANDRLLQMLGYTREDLRHGRLNWRQMTPAEYEALDARAIDELLGRGTMTPFEKEYIRADGSRLPVLIGGVMLSRESRSGAFFALDVSREVAARREIERLVRELNGAVRMRDDFLAIAGHEMRTPLTAALLSLQSIERAAQADAAMAPFLTRVRRASTTLKRLERLVDELLDVSQLLSGRSTLNPAPMELVSLVRAVVDRLSEAAAASGCALELRADGEVRGVWDTFRVEQLLTNLITNAFKFGEHRPVTVEVRREGSWAEMSVTDRGIGIAPEDQARIFQRFERAVPARHFGGMGLGLWIARDIA